MGRSEEPRPGDSAEYFASVEEAAVILDRSTRTVKTYIYQGILRAKKLKGHGKKLWIRRDDVKALRELNDKGAQPSDLFRMLKAVGTRLNSIEQRLDFLMHVNGLDVSLLRDAKTEQLVEIYDKVTEMEDEAPTNTNHKDMRKLAEVFLQFTELEYHRLVSPTLDTHPWTHFQNLCRHLMTTLRRRKEFIGNPDTQQTYRLLDKARKHIATSALSFEELRSAKSGPKEMGKIVKYGVSRDSFDRYVMSEIGEHLRPHSA